MVARSESPSWFAEGARAPLAAAAVALALFSLAWAVLHHGFYARVRISDVPVYQSYGELIVDGHLPYRDFGLEYPPAATPPFALPALGNEGDRRDYRSAFEVEMWVCGAVALVAMAAAFGAVGASRARLWGSLAFAALAPLALGSVVRARFDLWPAALATLAVAALLSGRRLLGGGVLGAAFAAKLWPVVLLPLAVAYVWRRAGRRAAVATCGAFVAVAGLVFLPFVILAPEGVHESFTRQASRPLQIESLGASFLLAAHQLGYAIRMTTSHGSQNLVGVVPDALATAQTVAQGLVLLGLWIAFARGPATHDRFLRYAAAAVCALIALGKVLSPQFLIWLIPLVPLVRGRRGVAASALLGVILVVTQLWFPIRYWRLADDFAAFPSWLVFARDLLLVALLGLLSWPTRRAPGPARSG